MIHSPTVASVGAGVIVERHFTGGDRGGHIAMGRAFGQIAMILGVGVGVVELAAVGAGCHVGIIELGESMIELQAGSADANR